MSRTIPALPELLDEHDIPEALFESHLLRTLGDALRRRVQTAGQDALATLAAASVPYARFDEPRAVLLGALRRIDPESCPPELLGELAAQCADSRGLLRALPVLLRAKLCGYDEGVLDSELKYWLDGFQREFWEGETASTDIAGEGLQSDANGNSDGAPAEPSVDQSTTSAFRALELIARSSPASRARLSQELRSRFLAGDEAAMSSLRQRLLAALRPPDDPYAELAELISDSSRLGALDVARTRGFFDRISKDVGAYSEAGMLIRSPAGMGCLARHFVGLLGPGAGGAQGDLEYVSVLMRVALRAREMASSAKLQLSKWQLEQQVKGALAVLLAAEGGSEAAQAEAAKLGDACRVDELARWLAAAFWEKQHAEGGNQLLEQLCGTSDVFGELHAGTLAGRRTSMLKWILRGP
ncbi:hypothetical protein DFJ74DRAFT_702852 [Hyaloraphidium curvatum]|nr:hypothetical protein DFJ74DRAFT_702852 [Hyaloraphidium curvatum]